jgi:uncharacterized protein (DUF1810 family)
VNGERVLLPAWSFAVFAQVLENYYDGVPDERTVAPVSR